MHKRGLTLVTHTGWEEATRVTGDTEAEFIKHQDYGNPLRFQLALSHGVRVIMSHIGRASEDDSSNLYIDNFFTMMNNNAYKGCLYGDVSALTIDDKQSTLHYLSKVRSMQSMKGRLLNGSDYPLPGVWLINPTAQLVKDGVLRRDQAKPLTEIYRHNPLLYDFVVKRTMGLPANMFYSIKDNAGPGYGCLPAAERTAA